MRDIKIGAAQFEPRDNDTAYNLDRIDTLTAQAVGQGAEIVSFHECCIQGYTFLMTLSREDLQAIAEPVPDGPSTAHLIELSRKHGVPIMAGLVEREDSRIYNTYVVVSPDGFIAKHRKQGLL